MSPIAAGLDGLLALLLVAALVLGARLNARLKALRDGQAGFAAAVLELNRAAARAEGGLTALKTAQEEAHDALLDRIEVARGLAARLERAGVEAERRGAERPVSGSALAAIAALAEGRSPPRATGSADLAPDRGPAGSESMEPRANPPPRRRPARGAFDEELFEAKPPRRDDPLGLGALDRAPAAPAATAALDLGPLAPAPLSTPAPTADRARPDPLRNWKAVR